MIQQIRFAGLDRLSRRKTGTGVHRNAAGKMRRIRRWSAPASAIFLAIHVAGSGASTAPAPAQPQLQTSAALPPAASGIDAYRQLVAYASIGLHRTGTEEDRRTTAWLDQQLRSFGLNTQVEPFEFNRFAVRKAALQTKDGSAVPVFPYWYSGTTGKDGINARLVDVGTGSQAGFDAAMPSGQLVLADIALRERAFFSDLANVIKRSSAAGAAGVVAVIHGTPDNLIAAANAESEAGLCGLPVLFVSAEDGDRLRKELHDPVHFTLDAAMDVGHTANVVATLPGTSSDTLMIGTPINGWFTAASERGGGVGTLLTLARAQAEHARKTKPGKTLVFVFTAGHELGYLGLQRYIDAHPEVIKKTYAYVHLGASVAGAYSFLQRDGRVVTAPAPDPSRYLFVSENPLLQKMVSRRQWTTPLLPAQNILPSVFNPGEQRRMYALGIPMVAMSGTTLYFHTEADLPSTTSAELLDPLVRFYSGVIDDLLATDPQKLRAANSVATAAAKPLPEQDCLAPPRPMTASKFGGTSSLR